MKVKLLGMFLASALCVQGAGRLPGRGVASKRLPAAVRESVVRHFANTHRFAYRSDRRFWYAIDEVGGYYQFTGEGAVCGFSLHMCQPPREIVEELPEAVVSRLRELYPGYYLCSFIPEGEGFRAGLFGERDRVVHFDDRGRVVREESGPVSE